MAQVLLAQGVGLGLGTGFMYVPGMAVVSHYFHRRRAFAMGLVASVRLTLTFPIELP